METLYKIMKILIAVLVIAVIVAGVLVLFPASDSDVVPAETAQAAEAAPDFTVYDIDGNACKLSDFQGKPVILNFWASWCGPCKSEMPDLEDAYQEYGDQIHFLTVNLTDGSTETVETASAYISQQGYTFPVYYDTGMDAASVYGINAIPMTYFLDAEGNFVYQVTGMMSAEVLQGGIDMLLDGK